MNDCYVIITSTTTPPLKEGVRVRRTIELRLATQFSYGCLSIAMQIFSWMPKCPSRHTSVNLLK